MKKGVKFVENSKRTIPTGKEAVVFGIFRKGLGGKSDLRNEWKGADE
jgi:hypothetical protein